MSKRKKKWTVTAIVVVLCAIVFILMDVFVFSTVKIADEKYANSEITYVRREPYELWDRGELRGLDDAKGEMGFDVRSMDLVRFTLTGQDDLLEEVVYDSDTKWPGDLPDGFDPEEILELGKDPGLGIRQLHDRGYTGEGVSIAIIDQGLNPEHKEYAEHLMGYELYHQLGEGASMHGAAVTSIAVGQSCGVAPGADLYYIASSFGRITPIGFKPDTNIVADAIYRVLEINELLPNEKKIRVISISKGFNGTLGGIRVKAAIDKATEQGIFVVTTSTDENYDFTLMGLGRGFLDNPNAVDSYVPGKFWEDTFYGKSQWSKSGRRLMVPMDSRTYASFTSADGYEFCSVGGMSWAVPWLSGLYALCVQKKPNITPNEFIEKAFETGTDKTIVHNGHEYTLGTIVDPLKLIESLYQH